MGHLPQKAISKLFFLDGIRVIVINKSSNENFKIVSTLQY